MSKYLVLLILVISNMLLDVSHAAEHEASPFKRGDWYSALSRGDLKAFVRIAQSAQSNGFPSVANDIAVDILSNPGRLPVEARDAAMSSEFRVEAALYLSLGVRNNVVDVDRNLIRSVAISSIGHAGALEARAMSALSHLRTPSDVPALLRVAMSADQSRYVAAIYALRVMCIPEADRALQELARNAKAEKLEVIRESEAHKRLCEPRQQ